MVQASVVTVDPVLLPLDRGERAAIVLATSLKVDAILMDDRAGVAAAKAKGFAVVGTLGILDAAARRSQVDLAQAPANFVRQRSDARTSFSMPCLKSIRTNAVTPESGKRWPAVQLTGNQLLRYSCSGLSRMRRLLRPTYENAQNQCENRKEQTI